MDETYVQFMNAVMKEQSKQSIHTQTPNRPMKFKEIIYNRKKQTATVFWDFKGSLLRELMAPGTRVT